MENAFLMSFVKKRAEESSSSGSVSKAAPKGGAGESVSHGPTIATIIEEKPSKSRVLEYFRQRIAELEAED